MRGIWTVLLLTVAVALPGAACKKKTESAGEPSAAPTTPTTAAATPTEPATPTDPTMPTEPATPTEPTAPVAGDLELVADEPMLAFVEGTVEALEEAGPQPLAEGASIAAGTIVAVAEGGQAELDLPDGSTVDLDELTELLVAEAFVENGVRKVELHVLAGAAHFTVAPSEQAGSYFRVKTEAGMTEVVGTVFAVEVGAEKPTTDVIVFEGKVEVASTDAKQPIEAKPEAPQAVQIVPYAPLATIDPAVLQGALGRWEDWADRQADLLILRHEIDVSKPEPVAVLELTPERHPLWRMQVELRRARVAHRVAMLAEAAGAEGLAQAADAKARFEVARVAWQAKVAGERHEAIQAYREARRAAWTARAEVRVQRHEALKETRQALREAHVARVQARGAARAAAAHANAAGQAGREAAQAGREAAQAGAEAAQAGAEAAQAAREAAAAAHGAVVVTPGPGGGGAVVVTPGAGAAVRVQAGQAQDQAAAAREQAAAARGQAAAAREQAAQAREQAGQARGAAPGNP